MMQKIQPHTAYVHARPGTANAFGIFYVGKGSSKRARGLSVSQRSTWHGRVVQKYGASNILVGVFPCSTEAVAFDLERGLIKCLRRMGVSLVNATEGGEGASGAKRTEETRKKMSVAISKAKKGKTPSEEVLARLRTMGVGRRFSDETKQKMSEAKKGKPRPPGLLTRCWEKRRETPVSAETRERLSRVGEGRIPSEDTRHRLSVALKGRVFSEEHRKKISEALRRRVVAKKETSC